MLLFCVPCGIKTDSLHVHFTEYNEYVFTHMNIINQVQVNTV